MRTVWDAEYCARGYNPVLMYCNASKTVVSALVSHPKLISRLIEIDQEHPCESRFTVCSTEWCTVVACTPYQNNPRTVRVCTCTLLSGVVSDSACNIRLEVLRPFSDLIGSGTVTIHTYYDKRWA